jgi:HPt (histidine-containing phosphotransfer) domain-containing protein
MTAPPPAPHDPLTFFTLEASDCLERLDSALQAASSVNGHGDAGPAADDVVRAARTLRGAATMHRLSGISDLAASVERAGRALRAHELDWSAQLHAALVASVDDLKILLHKVRTWGPTEDARSTRRIADLARYLPAGSTPAAGVGVAGRATAPRGSTGSTGSADAYFAAETAEIAAALDAYVARPAGRATLTGALARVRTLRGVAVIADRPPLPDVLDAIERAGRSIELAPGAAGDRPVEVLTASSQLLRRLATELAAGGTRSVMGTAEYQQFVGAIAALAVATEAADHIVPIGQLFFADGSPAVIEAAANPPTSPTERFRLEVVSQAEHLRLLIADAREASARQASSGEPTTANRAAGDLRQALRAVRNAAKSFGENDVAAFISPFADGARGFDFLALNSLDEMAVLLADSAAGAGTLADRLSTLANARTLDAGIGLGLSDIKRPPAGLQSTDVPLDRALGLPGPRARTTTPTGAELHALLQDGISGISHLADEPLVTDRPPAPVNGERALVPIESLVYRGRAALERARSLRDALKDGTTASPESLAEIFDLLDLASHS